MDGLGVLYQVSAALVVEIKCFILNRNQTILRKSHKAKARAVEHV